METKRIQVEEAKTQTTVNPENDVQRRLRAVLEKWGPNGEHWHSGYCDSSNTAGCAIWALPELVMTTTPSGQYEVMEVYFMDLAAKEMGFTHPTAAMVRCSDSGFHNARKMVLRAIELAATPVSE